MMNLWNRFLVTGTLVIAFLPLIAQTGGVTSSSSGEAKKKVSSPSNLARQGNGERKFAQNCSRCHNPPEGFPPSISGTIVRHMRVRASLSKEDEADILRFLNP